MAVAQTDINTFRDRITGRRVAESTCDQYETWIHRFEDWMGDGDPTLGALIDFDSYLADPDRPDYGWENATGRPAPDEYSHSSRQLALSALKLWVRLHYDETIEEDVQNIVSGEPNEFDPKYLSQRDIQTVLGDADTACSRPGCEAALRVSYDAILRGKELTRIQREDVDFETGTIYVRAVKGSNNMELALQRDTLDSLERHFEAHADREYPFWNAYGRKWKPGAWNEHVRTQHHEVGSHAIGRHSAIMHRLTNPGDFPHTADTDTFGSVFRRSRHSQPAMTARYARIAGIDIPDWGGGE